MRLDSGEIKINTDINDTYSNTTKTNEAYQFSTVTLSDSTSSCANIKNTPPVNDVNYIVPVAPDGGYGWIIVFAAFSCSFVVDGIATAFAPFIDEYTKQFDASVAIVGMIGSSLIGSYLIVGPLVSGLVNRYGVRKIAVIGSITAGTGFLTSIFAINPVTLILSYGIVAGTGLGFVYLPAMVIVCFYFEKKRSVAVGLAVAGSGVGTIVMPPLNSFLIKRIGCQGTLAVLAALGFLCILFSYLFKPLKPDSSIPLKEKVDIFPTDNYFTKQPIDGSVLNQNESALTKIVTNKHRFRAASESDNLSPNYFQTRRKIPDKKLISKSFSYGTGRRRISVMDYANGTTVSQTAIISGDSIAGNLADFAKPMSRSDIFYQGSIKNIPEFVEEGQEYTKYRAKYITIPALSDGSLKDEQNKVGLTDNQMSIRKRDWKCIQKFAKEISAEVIDINLLKEPAMILLCLSNIAAMLGFYIPFMFLSSMAQEKGIRPEDTEWLLSILGIFNTVGRVAFGWLADQGIFSPLSLNNFSLLISGLLTLLCPLYVTPYSVIGYSVLYGFIVSAFICLTTINITNLLGLNRLTNAFGLVIVSRSIASFIGTPLAGSFYGFTKSYDASFWFAGILIILGGVFTLLIPFFGSHKFTTTDIGKEVEKF